MISIDFNNEAVKMAPIAGGVAADGISRVFFGMSLNEWFYIAAIGYTVVQSWALIHRTLKGQNKEG